ncbi:rhodanese-like domain-containing protein [Poseidonibacter antarcticus]|uniref:rhodanese-like domain-containing protein n=1 Tax=Poseidonibacter antarcticus TaxID=2478538 RepID=UPI000EF4BC77|nr:rhodanese-like domain-containing protein [Poseidonibacter antarcticus]
MMKILFIFMIFVSVIFADTQINYNTAKLYKEDISSSTAYKMQQKGALLIDVRTKVEFEESRAKNSINIPIFKDQNGKRVFNKAFLNEVYQASNRNLNKKILLICRSGSRTKVASNILAQQGFKDIYNIQYGFQYDWLKVGLPTQR